MWAGRATRWAGDEAKRQRKGHFCHAVPHPPFRLLHASPWHCHAPPPGHFSCASSKMCVVAFSSAGFNASGVQMASSLASSSFARCGRRAVSKRARWCDKSRAHVSTVCASLFTAATTCVASLSTIRSRFLRPCFRFAVHPYLGGGAERKRVFCDAAGPRLRLAVRGVRREHMARTLPAWQTLHCVCRAHLTLHSLFHAEGEGALVVMLPQLGEHVLLGKGRRGVGGARERRWAVARTRSSERRTRGWARD